MAIKKTFTQGSIHPSLCVCVYTLAEEGQENVFHLQSGDILSGPHNFRGLKFGEFRLSLGLGSGIHL